MSIPSSPLGDPSALRMRLRAAIDENPGRKRYALVAVVIVVVAFWFYGQSRSEPVALSELPRASAATGSPSSLPRESTTTSTEVSSQVVVQVVGAVTSPGVYAMSDTDRINDAVAKAGGMTSEADVVRVNLAAKLVDGQQVFVPKVGEAASVAVASPAGSSGPSDANKIVNLNTATVEDLDALPGIGPSLAAAIVAHRDKAGPFKSVKELNDVKGIGDSKFADLEDKVTV